MDIVNLWKSTGDRKTDKINIIKSWLCGSTDGQTYPITDYILEFNLPDIESSGYEYEFPESAFDEIVGFKHDYNVDDENLESVAKTIYHRLLNLNDDVRKHPENYFRRKNTRYNLCRPSHDGITGCDYCVGFDNECTYIGDCPFKKPKTIDNN